MSREEIEKEDPQKAQQDEDGTEVSGEPEYEARVGWRYTLSQIKRDPTAMFGLGIVAVMTILATFAFIDSNVLGFLEDFKIVLPFVDITVYQTEFFDNLGVKQYWIADTFWFHPERDPSGEIQTQLPPYGFSNMFHESGELAHPLGTDNRGRDMLVRIVYGTKVAMQVGVFATLIGMLGGTIIGAVSGYYGGWVDDTLQRIMDTMASIPLLILVLVLLGVVGARGLYPVMFAVGFVSTPLFNRLIRSEVVSVREEEYVEAAKAAGVKERNIIFRHVVPNSFAPVIVQATLQVGVNILILAGLSFLGFGVQPPTPSWGQILSQSRNYMLPNFWYSVWPGLMIMVTVMGFNMFGDGLRDALDPKIKN